MNTNVGIPYVDHFGLRPFIRLQYHITSSHPFECSRKDYMKDVVVNSFQSSFMKKIIHIMVRIFISMELDV